MIVTWSNVFLISSYLLLVASPTLTLPCHETHSPLRQRKCTKYWHKNLINSKYINIKTRWRKKGLSDGFELWVLPSLILNSLNEKRIQAFKTVDGRLSKGVIWKLNLFLFICNQIKWTIKENKIKAKGYAVSSSFLLVTGFLYFTLFHVMKYFRP